MSSEPLTDEEMRDLLQPIRATLEHARQGKMGHLRQWAAKDVPDMDRVLRALAARLSHDRGADAFVKQVIEDIEEAERQTGEPLDSEGIANILHENLREAALSVPAPTLPALDAESVTVTVNREALARALHKERGRSHWKRHPEWPCPNCDAETSAVLVNYAEALRDAV